MSGGHGHDDHGHDDHGHGGGGGGGFDFGITSMIGGFFGAVSGANAMKNFREGKGGGGGHEHH